MTVPPNIDDADHRIARRERINEIYRRAWDPTPTPAGLPLTPDDHINTMRWCLTDGLSLRDCPAVQDLIAADPVAGYEYALLLVEEALDLNRDPR
jgi:hypothetical protein